jgi:hypothetical protein
VASKRLCPIHLKAYGIRAGCPDQMDAELAYGSERPSRGCVSNLYDTPWGLQVAVDRDMRLSTPVVTEHYTAGILDERWRPA